MTPVLAPCGVASVMNLQSEHRISNSRNRKGTGYVGGDADSVSAEIYLRPSISDPVLLQIDTQFEIVNIHPENCSTVFDITSRCRHSTSSGRSAHPNYVGLIKLSLLSMLKSLKIFLLEFS